MVRMIPPYPREGANRSEREVFMALESIVDRPDWVVIHSLSIGQNLSALTGEADFVVVAPGKGILLIEAKSPKYVAYEGGDWYLERTPNPAKDPLKQLESARRSIRGFLRERELLQGDEPIARLLWFTSLGRHLFENKSPGDMQFFEWELGWRDDLQKPARLIEHVLEEHIAWFAEVDAVELDPSAMSVEHTDAIVGALLNDFTVHQSKGDEKRERAEHEAKLLAEQRFALELIENNDHVYFDGPAGTGKSFLVAEAARRFVSGQQRTLVTCWNLLMADELRRLVGSSSSFVEVADLNTVMLRVCGLPTNPADAGTKWFEEELPRRTLEHLRANPHLGAFEAICVDEFQDIAGNLLLLEVLFTLAGTGKPKGTKLVFAGDESQQILRPEHQRTKVFATAKELVPDLVHVKIRRNCRIAPSLVDDVQRALGRGLGFTSHRMPRSVPGTLSAVGVVEGRETSALVTALKALLERFEPDDIVVLSPFGEQHSLVGELMARAERSADERWLRKQLKAEGSAGRIRWRSIFKFKGLEAEAVVITDVSERAAAFLQEHGLDLDGLLYVGLTRGKYACVVLDSSGRFASSSVRTADPRASNEGAA